MKTKSEYQADIVALETKKGDINAVALAENRDLTGKELDVIDDINDRIKFLQRTIKTLDESEKISDVLAQPEVRHTVETTTPARHAEIVDERRERFGSLGEQMAAIVRAGVPGGSVDPRLLNRAATGLSEATPSDGGFLVQQDFSSELYKAAFEMSNLANRCRKVQISGNSNSIKLNGLDETSRATGSRWGGVRGYWVEEAGEKTASKPKFRKLELNLKKLVGLCYATDELLSDSSALGGIIEQGFKEEIAFMVDDAIVNGNGVGQPLGILNSGCLVSQSAETGQTASTVVYENIVNMWSRLMPMSQKNAIWLINQDVTPQLYTMSLAVGTGGGPVYLPPGGAAASPYASLFGRPVIPIEQCKTLGTVGDIILADMNGYIMAEKGGLQTDMSIHVRFVYDESVFRFVVRVDGQPILGSAITPANGSNTLSTFVALATRS